MKKVIIRLFNLTNITYPYAILITYLSWFILPFTSELTRTYLQTYITIELLLYVYPLLGIAFLFFSIINRRYMLSLLSILLIFAFPVTMIIGYLLLGV